MPLYREKVPYVVVVGGPNVSAMGVLKGRADWSTRWCLRACCWAALGQTTA